MCDDGWYLTPDGFCVADCLAAGWFRIGINCVECCYEEDDTGVILGPDYTDGGLCKQCNQDNCLACHFSSEPDFPAEEQCDLCAPGTTWVGPDVDDDIPAYCDTDEWFEIVTTGFDFSYFQITRAANMGCGFGVAYSSYAA